MLKVKAIKVEDPLPEDLIIEILSWLPVKTLLQFKCVCKSWYAIITSQAFISKHLNNYYANNNDSNSFLARYSERKTKKSALYEFSVDETYTLLSYKKLGDLPMNSSYILGPCNGIFYLGLCCYSDRRALWNPATNELKTLPPLIRKPNLPSHISHDYVLDVLGFGFDIATEDYKVIVFKYGWSTTVKKLQFPLSVFVYSLSTDSWRYWGDLPQKYRFLGKNKCYTYLKGVFYWLGSDGDHIKPEAIISFDMATDLIQEMDLPNYDEPYSKSAYLSIYHDSLALLTVHDTKISIKKFIEIWTLNEEGSWTKQFTVGTSSYSYISPITHLNNGKFIFECVPGVNRVNIKLTLFDPVSQEITDCGCPLDYGRCQGIFVYRDSLVSFKDRNGCQENSQGSRSTSIMDSHRAS